MNKILNMIIKIFIIILIIQTISVPISNASTSWEDIFSSAENFLKEGANQEKIDKYKLKEVTDSLYNILFSIGVAASVLVGAVMGIQFMWGSIEQKAKVKEMMFPYVIGCVLVFGAFGIWSLIVNIGEEIFPAPITSTTYTKTENGKLYCDNCGDELVNIEQRRAKCSQCGKSIKGI